MKAFLSLIKLQLKDKIDMSFAKQKKTLIRTIVFGILSFAIVAAVTFLALFFLKFIGLISNGEIANLLIVIITIYFVLDVLGSSFELMKNLYFAEDNKLLVTYPVSAGQLFLSKIIVYYVFELKKCLKLFVPIVVGFLFSMLTSTLTTDGGITFISQITIASIFSGIFPILIYAALVVVVGSILSVPALYVYSFIKRHALLQLLLTTLLVAGVVVVCVLLINSIPEEIILEDWIFKASAFIKEFVNIGAYYAYPFRQLVYMITGELVTYGLYRLNYIYFIKLIICLAALAALAALVYFVIKPFYFYIMTSGSEFDNNQNDKNKVNKVLSKYITFSKKELIISFRDVDISGNYIAIYIIVPILLLFIDAIYSAISKNLSGETMTLAFNLLLILTPLLASNSMIATLYSKEGRAAYIKKTKPVNPIIPLVSKLLFNLVLSIPSIAVCGIIFADFSNMSPLNVILLCFAVLFIQYAHILFSASLDIMNPKNEVYATDGNMASNPNENVATVVGFMVSILLAFIFYSFLNETMKMHHSFNLAFIKLFVIGLAAFAGCLYLFIMKIKAFYYEK